MGTKKYKNIFHVKIVFFHCKNVMSLVDFKDYKMLLLINNMLIVLKRIA